MNFLGNPLDSWIALWAALAIRLRNNQDYKLYGLIYIISTGILSIKKITVFSPPILHWTGDHNSLPWTWQTSLYPLPKYIMGSSDLIQTCPPVMHYWKWLTFCLQMFLTNWLSLNCWNVLQDCKMGRLISSQ